MTFKLIRLLNRDRKDKKRTPTNDANQKNIRGKRSYYIYIYNSLRLVSQLRSGSIDRCNTGRLEI